jgi:murein DD-endopeptidase MepM/ murein hydrolase activator NlpD
MVRIDHGNGISTCYAHLSRIEAKVGAGVNRGDVIGTLGSTGRSTGPHLHYEVRVKDKPVDPEKYLTD